MYLLMPERKLTGKKTMEVVEVAASTASETSMPPFSAASRGGYAHLHIAEDVFQHDHRVVDQPREGQRQAAQNHGVDGAAHGIGEQQADQRGKRNGQQDRERGARAAQEEQDHQAGEHQADAGFFDKIPDRKFDEDRLIEDHRGLQRRQEYRPGA